MGAKCSRTAPAPQLPDETLDDMSVLELNDSAIDHMPVGYSVRRRQAVNVLCPLQQHLPVIGLRGPCMLHCIKDIS